MTVPSVRHHHPPLPSTTARVVTTAGRPPAQVYTRGTTGAVKTRNGGPSSKNSVSSGGSSRQQAELQPKKGYHRSTSSGSHQPYVSSSPPIKERRSRSQTRDDVVKYSSRSKTMSASPRRGSMHHSNTSSHYPVKPSRSDIGYNYPQHNDSSYSDQGSVHSTPSYTKKPHIALEYRDAPASHPVKGMIPSVNKPHRDYSPSRTSSHESTKHYVKTARRVIEDLNRAQGAAERRIAAVTNACDVFDHGDESRHNIELYHGAAHALAKLLQVTHNDDEIRMILSALEMVFRSSPKSAQAAYSKIGSTLLSHLLRLLDRFETRNMKHADISILNISKLLHYLSRSSDLRATLCRQSGMMHAMARVSTRVLNPDCRLVRIRIIANLANCEENKVLMYEQEGMLDSILRIGHFDSSDLARQHAANALMEFSSAPANQVTMARNDTALATLVKMVLVEKSSSTREFSITALQNLAFTKENRLRLVTFKKGVVLEALKKALSADPDPKARRRAAGALTNLACDETAETMGNHKGLLDTLAIVATKDENMDVQTRASLALTKIASSITVEMDCHEALLDALVVASLSKASNSVSAVLRVKARCPENREALARHPGVIDTLADICVSDGSHINDRDNSIRAIMHLVNEDKNRKIMCSKTILDALVVGANYKDPDLDEARDSAVRAIERLATEVSNRPFMAHHEGLLVTVAKAAEREAKWEQAGRESEYGYLAKPLLMSLLVAM